MLFTERIKQLREQKDMLQRKVAAILDVDAGLYSKIERGERPAKREQVIALAKLFEADQEELLTLWLADQIDGLVAEDTPEVANSAMKLVSNKKNKTLQNAN